MNRLKMTLDGTCTRCGNAASVIASANIDMSQPEIEIKKILTKQQELLIKDAESMVCDECFMADKFGLPDNLVQEIVQSSSSGM